MADTIKYILDESRIPKTWYNLAADLPKPLPPVLQEKATYSFNHVGLDGLLNLYL